MENTLTLGKTDKKKKEKNEKKKTPETIVTSHEILLCRPVSVTAAKSEPGGMIPESNEVVEEVLGQLGLRL